MKKNQAITVIALIITVIVILILAGISISMISGDNGILTKSKLAKEQSNIGQFDEQTKLDGIDNQMSSMVTSRGTTTANLNYSLTEQETGNTWINNKKIYQRTIEYPITTYGENLVIENESSYNIDEVISCDGFFKQAGNHEAFIGFRYDSTVYYFLPYYSYSTKSLIARVSNLYVGFTAYITVQYTKNT